MRGVVGNLNFAFGLKIRQQFSAIIIFSSIINDMDEKTIRHYEENVERLLANYGAATEPLRVTFRTTFKKEF